MSSGNTLLGLLAGAAIGAALGLLYAPQKGSDTRQQICDKSDEVWENLKSKFEDLFASAGAQINELEKDAEDTLAKGQQKANDLKSDTPQY